MLVGNLKADGGFARNHLNYPDTGSGKRTGQVLGKVGDLAYLHPRRRLQLEAGDHRSWMDRLYLHLDIEVLEFHLHQARHRLQRFHGDRVFGCLRLIQQ